MSISKPQKLAIQERAKGCGEYCRLAFLSGVVPFHIDHVIPVKHGGSDDKDNLAFACYSCNAHKSHDLTGYDPKTGLVTVLYHPRNQTWTEHFEIASDMKILGLSPEGRTTILVLQMNEQERVETRQILAEIGEYPC